MKRRFSASSAKSAGPLMENMDIVTEHITATVKNQVMHMIRSLPSFSLQCVNGKSK